MEDSNAAKKTDESFGKVYKLCSLIDIDTLFKSGKTVSTPNLRVKFRPLDDLDTLTSSFKVLISVPKRNVKKAHDRNRIKRVLREVIRKNKTELSSFLKKKKINLHFALIYQQKNSPLYPQLESEFKTCIQQMTKKLQNEQKS
jgi:ribonuclease P protein component